MLWQFRCNLCHERMIVRQAVHHTADTPIQPINLKIHAIVGWIYFDRGISRASLWTHGRPLQRFKKIFRQTRFCDCDSVFAKTERVNQWVAKDVIQS